MKFHICEEEWKAQISMFLITYVADELYLSGEYGGFCI